MKTQFFISNELVAGFDRPVARTLLLLVDAAWICRAEQDLGPWSKEGAGVLLVPGRGLGPLSQPPHPVFPLWPPSTAPE